MRRIVFILVALFILSIAGYTASAFMSETVTARLGPYTFDIPKKYARQGSIPRWVTSLSGLDDGSRAFLLEFPAEELADTVPGYQSQDGHYVEVIRAILNVLEPYEVARYENPNRYRDLWEKLADDKERIAEPFRDIGWFKVYSSPNHYLWEVVRMLPDNEVEMPKDPLGFWVASCRTGAGESPITETGEVEDCLTYAFYNDIAIEFYISGQNLHLIDEVRAYLRDKVESWRVQ